MNSKIKDHRSKIILVVGARPNIMKAAPIYAEMMRRADEFAVKIVHTGQHYDTSMSDAFFDDLGLPEPDHHLGVGSASHTVQTAKIMLAFEPIVIEERPDWVIVVGDVNSTAACALVCAKLGVKVAHVEAGLRSGDRTMPEEINRIVTDSIADLLLTPSEDADENLKREGIPAEKIRFVGNVMIDSLLQNLKRSEFSNIREDIGLQDRDYAVLTLHRPSNVDARETLEPLIDALIEIGEQMPVIFPVHPRTRAKITEFGLESRIDGSGLRLIEPLGYLDFLRLYSGAGFVMTDSGGLQEETTALGIPCLTIRENTERPITVEMGTNQVVGTEPERLKQAVLKLISGSGDSSGAKIPPLWDGKTAERICDALY
ncbi:MAG: UDP-N-acetylglucosamine 2-epimerase (non-hydrolyzing) [Pyrinomonadaceae bacterium]|nr:UDP-N-acetylglucosamine 2-epimerase (non-hydrolyzing) [Blastocatellia bacterium]MCW5955023.1 UDP-N-acetylglucosamine 2-epimerase (non-hydrolyzing) [Pyrinomonadaceae bacterium]